MRADLQIKHDYMELAPAERDTLRAMLTMCGVFGRMVSERIAEEVRKNAQQGCGTDHDAAYTGRG